MGSLNLIRVAAVVVDFEFQSGAIRVRAIGACLLPDPHVAEVDLPAPDAVAGRYDEVEHIQSGQRWRFTSMDDLIAFLRTEALVSPERRNTK